MLCLAIFVVISQAFIIEEASGKMTFSGNRTECALLLLTDKTWGLSYEKIRHNWDKRVFKLFGFSSARKMASVVVEYPDKLKVFNKGAAEWVLARCSHCWQTVRAYRHVCCLKDLHTTRAASQASCMGSSRACPLAGI